MDTLDGVVNSRTRIGRGYREHAAIQSIDAYLNDWQAAYHRLGRRIQALECLRDERIEQIDRGEWPRPPDPLL